MKNKNLRKLKYVSGNPQNTGFFTIYPTASGGLGGPQTPSLNFSASLHSPFSTYFFKIASYFWKCWKPCICSCKSNYLTNPSKNKENAEISIENKSHCVKNLSGLDIISEIQDFILWHHSKEWIKVSDYITKNISSQRNLTAQIAPVQDK